MNLEVDFSLEHLDKRVQAAQHLDFGVVKSKTKKAAKSTQTSDLQDSEIINLCCLKLLNMW